MREIELDYEPRKKIMGAIKFPEGSPEMMEQQSAFLAGLIEMKKPKKLLEVGVAEGGTTAIILQCLADHVPDCRMYSIDYCVDFYKDKSKKTGWVGELARQSVPELRGE